MIKQKPLEEIETESSRKTIRSQHEKFGKTISINCCFGSSNIGQMTGFIAIKLVKEISNAFMRCPLALWSGVEGPTQVLLHDNFQVIIDGCKKRCLKKTLERAGIKENLSYALDEDFGLKKTPGPDFDERQMREVAARIKKDIESIAPKVKHER